MIAMDAALAVRESSQVGGIRRHATAVAQAIGLPESEAGKVEIIVNEISTNILKHGGANGRVFVRAVGDGSGIEILGLDRGGGIANITHSLRDGVSTARTQGIGLGGIQRLAHEFDIHSSPSGTVIVARLWREPGVRAARFAVGAVNVPIEGEIVSGDGWCTHEGPGTLTLLHVDGLGHGPIAHNAAIAATDVFHLAPELPLPELMKDLHVGLRSTRGAAVSLVRIDAAKGLLYYCGVGNVGGAVVLPGSDRRLASLNGTVGLQMPSLREFSYPFPSDATLVTYSDGLVSRWDIASIPGLLRKDPSVIAAVLQREFTRGRDDASVVVVRGIPRGIA